MKSIYLDNNASTRVDPIVMKAMRPYFTEHYANPSSVFHADGNFATTVIQQASEVIADYFQVFATHDIIFTSGATESNNLAIKGVIQASNKQHKHIITSVFEHESVLAVCKSLKEQGVSITYVPVNNSGFVNISDIESNICNNTALISIMAANNEIGTIQPIQEIGELAQKYGIPFHTDATQFISLGTLNLDRIKADLVTFSSHKIYGPKGVGGLYVNTSAVKLFPQILGGNQQRGFRSGTYKTPGIVGMATAFKLLAQQSVDENKRIEYLRNVLLNLLSQKHETIVNGSIYNRIPSNLNVTFPGVPAIALAAAVPNIMFSSGSACSSHNAETSHVLSAIGIDKKLIKCSIRLSLSRFTTIDEIQLAADNISIGINKIINKGNIT